jgi:two-component system, chemotaxis family, sensor kinase CheA
MNPLLEQFLSESRDALQGIAEKLMQLEQEPDDAGLMNELFRYVHTLKGNSGLFDFPEMTRVLHAGEDLMDAVREGRVAYSRDFADMLLDAMDFIGMLCDEIELKGELGANHASASAELAQALRALNQSQAPAEPGAATECAPAGPGVPDPLLLAGVPETVRMEAYRRARDGEAVHWLSYTPAEECFFQGDDPFHQARQTPGLLWGSVAAREPWPRLAELDAYRCLLDFQLLTLAPYGELVEYYRYVPEQLRLAPLDPLLLVVPQGELDGGADYDDFVAALLQQLEAGDLAALRRGAQALQELSSPQLWLSSALRWLLLMADDMSDPAVLRVLVASLATLTPPDWAGATKAPSAPALAAEKQDGGNPIPAGEPVRVPASAQDAEALAAILADQRQILMLGDRPAWLAGRLRGVACTLTNCSRALGDQAAGAGIAAGLAEALATGDGAPLLNWLAARDGSREELDAGAGNQETAALACANHPRAPEELAAPAGAPADEGPRYGRRAEDQGSAKSLKVDQVKINRLMDLIGEMVVSKNALPYLAQRAENHFGVRELAREIKAQYAVINRIAEEMQDAIMQVQMMPVSFVFQRFPRLVRDLSNKLGKEVRLVFEGEETEADKNIIEALADPLIHIVRNSLDHGLETPEVRLAAGKTGTGTLTIRAAQEADRVVIEIRDDGKGIDPALIKRKAYEKGIIDEATLERISDREAVNLVFAAGFSTAETVSDLSGRGVGMDVVRSGVERVGGSIQLESAAGKGTHLRISLPLSMAVTRVMIVESDRQLFGVPMDHVVETVRVPRSMIHSIKQSRTTVLRGRIVPLKSLNTLLEIPAETQANGDGELAVLVARVGGEVVGLLVDDFCETVDIIQKPLNGVLAGLGAYSGSALMGDGTVLMVLNLKEVVRCP